MATYSSNTTIKIGSVVTNYQTSTNPSTLLTYQYTVPANSYLKLIVFNCVGDDLMSRVTIAGGVVNISPFTSENDNDNQRIFPAGSVLRLEARPTGEIFTSGIIHFVGQLFQNTP